MNEPQLIVTRRRSRAWYAGVIAGALLALWSFFWMGGRFAQQRLEEQTRQIETLRSELQIAEEQLNDLSTQLVMQQQSLQVDNQSHQQLLDTIKNLLQEQAQLQEELNFYRRVMSPEDAKKGLTIADLTILQAGGDRRYDFKLALAQVGRQSQYLRGRVDLTLLGEENGQPKRYSIRELGAFADKQFEFQFRYFQNIEGTFTVPEQFKPVAFEVTARTRGLRKNQTASKRFPWTL